MSVIEETGFSRDKIVANGNKFLIGNGYLGYRGTLDEFTAKECVGLNIAGFYDGVAGKWRETLNAFNPFYAVLMLNDCELTVFSDKVVSHSISLDLSCGMFTRKTVFDVDGIKVELYCERFVNAARKNNLCSKITVSADGDIRLKLKVGVDTNVWELNGPHYKNIAVQKSGQKITALATAQESGTPLKVTCKFSVPFDNAEQSYYDIDLKGSAFVLERVAEVLLGEESETVDYGAALEEHRKEWARLWKIAALSADSARANLALEYSIYHLLILMPKGDYSIAARGLSGQTYKGAVFWDTEIFILPFFLKNFPKCSENLIKYRIKTLDAAREKARFYGYGGAFYAWESQDGYDACSDFNVTDVFTHRPVRTYFKDKQIHISAAVAYAVLKYYSQTGNVEIMLDGGLETVLECAEFARTYSYYNHVKKRYELLDVIGPDEYHERVNNNAYTNYMFHKITVDALEVVKRLKKSHLKQLGMVLEKFDGGFLKRLEEWADALYLPQPNDNGLIEQFDGYFGLEDTSVANVRSRLVHPNEYWGGSGGVATATRVIKQADLIMLFNLYPDLFPIDVQRANYEFYLPYTEHGSSLSRCAYALTACRLNKKEEAYDAFLNSAEIDLNGDGKQWAGEIYIGGTHPAASGGAWMTAVYGFNYKKRG